MMTRRIVMAGPVPAIHVLEASKTWMLRTKLRKTAETSVR
jgi:hypothetical protein